MKAIDAEFFKSSKKINRRKIEKLYAKVLKIQDDLERKQQNARKAALLKRIPELKTLKNVYEPKAFNALVTGFLTLLDEAVEQGFNEAPRGSAPGGVFSRGDTWTCAPGTHGVSCPCVQPSIPGPSGLS